VYLIYCLDRANSEKLRAELRTAHIEYLESQRDKIALIGPTLNPVGNPDGMMLILDVVDRKAAEGFLANEPFVIGNLFVSSEIRPWRAAMGYWFEKN
jgi:uncharacterized protein YciI